MTEQEQVTKALRMSEEELRQILDLAPQLVAVLGPGRERIYATRMALTYYGVNLDEWRQRSFGPEVHPDDFDMDLDQLVQRSAPVSLLTATRTKFLYSNPVSAN